VTLKNVIFSLKVHSTTHQKGRLGNWERKIGNFSGRRLFVRGSKVMLIVRVRLQFNYLYLEDFCNFGFYRSGSVCVGLFSVNFSSVFSVNQLF